MGHHHRTNSVERLTRMAERNNVYLTIAFGNSIWPGFAAFVDEAHRLTPDQLRGHERTRAPREALTELMTRTPVLKVKVYDARGLTVFSTDPRQIGDALELAKLDAGKLELSVYNTDVPSVVGSVCDPVEERAKSGEIEIVTDICPDPPPIQTDPNRLRQILHNLPSNALKFTPPGGNARVSARSGTPNGSGSVTITVADTGIGMRGEDIPLALASFGRIGASPSRNFDGTGLGLPLSKKLAELLGGSLRIRSPPAAGTTVDVTLPTDGPNARAGRGAEPAGGRIGGASA